jgi:pimeloyl-ACP methyl ester carboxylesterase
MQVRHHKLENESALPRIQSNGINLYYEIHGTGQPLLFIHGLGSCVRNWEFQIPEFSKSHQVITFDLRGHGQSDKPSGPYSLPMFAADAIDLLKALGIDSTHVVGISLGGAIAFQLALDAPGLVKTLTIVNSAPLFFADSFTSKVMLWQRQISLRLLGMKRMGQLRSRRLFTRPEQADLRRRFVERWSENNPRAYLAALQAMIDWNVTAQLSALHVPTLVVAADQDATPVSFKAAYAAKIPNAQLVVIPDSRHATPMERPQQFNQTLKDFLDR